MTVKKEEIFKLANQAYDTYKPLNEFDSYEYNNNKENLIEVLQQKFTNIKRMGIIFNNSYICWFLWEYQCRSPFYFQLSFSILRVFDILVMAELLSLAHEEALRRSSKPQLQ